MENRIRELRRERGLRQVELAEYLGVKQNTLSTWETGRYEPDGETLRKLSDFFGVPVDDLLSAAPDGRGRGEVRPAVVRVPVLGSIRAGVPLEAVEDVQDWEELPGRLCAGGKEYFALRVSGDSMWPDYLPGDIVIVHKTPCCASGDVCVVYVGDYEATLKQVKLGEDGSLSILPRNPSYPPRTFCPEEVRSLPVQICGVVVELRRKIK